MFSMWPPATQALSATTAVSLYMRFRRRPFFVEVPACLAIKHDVTESHLHRNTKTVALLVSLDFTL